MEVYMLPAVQQGLQLDLPPLGTLCRPCAAASAAMPPLLYADGMALLATSPAGLQA